MKKIKVYLQKPWKFSEDSPYYTSLIENPPKDIVYITSDKKKFIQTKGKLRLIHFVKNLGRRIINSLNPSMPNARYTPDSDNYDLIHCARCMSKNKKPWICDIESLGNLWVSGRYDPKVSRRKVLKYLISPHCKKIMAWTEWCANDIKRVFPEIKDKVEVVYPAISPKKFKKIKTGKTVLLFVSRLFYFKGGLYAVEAMDRITKKNKDIEGWIVSDVPEEVLKRYSKNPQLKFLGLKKQKELFEEIYPSADIFLYPSFTDTFGFAILEAMSFGLPVVCVDGLSRRELVEDGKTGVIVNAGLSEDFSPKIMEKLDNNIAGKIYSSLLGLIRDKIKMRKLSISLKSRLIFKKFSIEERNRRYLRILKS